MMMGHKINYLVTVTQQCKSKVASNALPKGLHEIEWKEAYYALLFLP